ncbi:MAG TPA: MBOAT family O-acyltransferase, partial [Candidatus Polarisedimenticolia bacterium]|nr:MBOAT family O-acyltransferase [Candidatus Polarisedimenticolia bacterium]
MVFSSVEFLLFFAFVLAIFWGMLGRPGKPASCRPQHLFLLLASFYFYMSWNAVLIVLILFSTLVDYLLAARIHASTCPRRRRTLLILSLVINLGLLGLFKYANFFIDNTNAVLGMFSLRVPFVVDILLPVGISFFTFQSMSYTIDVYRRELQPARSFADFALFVSFFPQLVAGPIVRASQFLPQLDRPRRPGDIDIAHGLNYLLLGLVKKLLISDWLSTIADPLFANPLEYNGLGAWMGVIAYTLQIYCDFSGYSDMAIGTAALLGYRLPDNFNMPYLSRNISEFWSRWHMSLST